MKFPENTEFETCVKIPINALHLSEKDKCMIETHPTRFLNKLPEILKDMLDCPIEKSGLIASHNGVFVCATLKTEITGILSEQTMRKMMKEDNRISGIAYIDINDMINGNIEDFNDLLSEQLTGTDLLTDISYEIIGIADNQTALIYVTGDAANILELSD